LLTALATFGLLGIGGLVTSHGAGMAVPDWPTSYGYNMFFLPIHFWKGGVFYEHTHRLWATVVGILTVALARWLGGAGSRRPLAVVGLLEMLAGFLLLKLYPGLSGAGHFLTGIGVIVVLAAAVWARNEPAPRPLPMLGWLAFAAVQLQGLLGGLRVVLFKDQIGIFHAVLAQMFFVLLCAIGLLTSKRWGQVVSSRDDPGAGCTQRVPTDVWRGTAWMIACTTGLILLQLGLGAAMRHQHAGLAIPDFPLAYGKLWPATDPQSVAHYNQQRIEVTATGPITSLQIQLQMAHRIVAVLILAGVAACVWRVCRAVKGSVGELHRFIVRLSRVWLGILLVQISLGALTIWTNMAADIATAHVLGGALSLATGAILSIVSFQSPESVRAAHVLSGPTAGAQAIQNLATPPSATAQL
jgi:cytochrome c oxidase assembly protein subunit 15